MASNYPFIFMHSLDEIKFKCQWILYLDDFNNTIPYDTIALHNEVLKLRRSEHPNIICKNICYIMQTSGSTGVPKTVRVEANCINSNIQSIQYVMTQSARYIY